MGIEEILNVGDALAATLDEHLWERWNLEDEEGQEVKKLIERWYAVTKGEG